MPETLRIQDLPAHDIAELLAEDGNDLSPRQVIALQQFIEDIGGIENAYAAVEMLSELENAA
ncbi:MAG: hypothetical protein KJ000_04985 [Pirellulaceae bacterium]|nr:hypothetical protein [Pirellulaceae bacterium]